MRVSIRIFVFGASLLAMASAFAGVIDRANDAKDASGTWLAWGGETRFHFNPDELDRIGVAIRSVDGASSRTPGAAGVRYETDAFPALVASGLEINHEGQRVTGLGGGALRHAGGLELGYAGGTIDLRGFALRASPDTRLGIDVVDASGQVWFTADHAHWGFDSDAGRVFSMRHMNLRLSARFASLLGHPEWTGDPVGGLDFHANSYAGAKSVSDLAGACSAPWPDPPNSQADVGLIYDNAASGWTGFDDSVYVKRCNGCTTTSTDGTLVVNQDSSLRNVGTTAVAWYSKFEGSYPPYDNDQHPFLVWNLYRIGADGRIKQIGVSGVKHAFYTVNWNCGCPGGNVIWPTCEDTYSNYNNDSSSDLGPRSEIIPYTAQWGRCGSVYDENCDGSQDSNGGAQDLYQFRMNVAESDVESPLADGARYFQEYWYIARDDKNIYNSMGYREIAFQKNSGSWSISLVGDTPNGADFYVGPLLNDWIDPNSPPANAANRELATPLGRARVAVRTTDLGNGQWRYEYAVMNYDYSHSEIDAAHPTEPNLMVDSNHGFVRFSVPVGTDVAVSGLRFDDTDLDATNDWTASQAGGAITWSAPASGNTLDWGTMYHFEFVADAAPGGDRAVGLVGAATASEGEIPYSLEILAPSVPNDAIFVDGFETN